MARLARRIGDKHVLRIVRRFPQAGMMQDGMYVDRQEGTPQGGPLSPLLANLLLDDLDRELEGRGHCFCRYADDGNIYVHSQVAGERVMASVVRFLEGKLRLRVNREKSAVMCRGTQIPRHKILLNGKLGIAPNSLKRAQGAHSGDDSTKPRRELGAGDPRNFGFLNGWLLYLPHAGFPGDLIRMEEWRRRKLRCLRLRNANEAAVWRVLLRHLGVPPQQAACLASTGKCWWRMDLSPQANQVMSRDWFCRQGLINAIAKYDELHI